MDNLKPRFSELSCSTSEHEAFKALKYLLLLNRQNGTTINMKASSVVNSGFDFR